MKISKDVLKQLIIEELNVTISEEAPTPSSNIQTILDMIQALPPMDRAKLVTQVRTMDSSGMTKDQLKAYQDQRRAAIKAGQPDPALAKGGQAGSSSTSKPPPPPPPPGAAVDPNKPMFKPGMDPKSYMDKLKQYYKANPDKDPMKMRSPSKNAPPPPPPPASKPAEKSGNKVADLLKKARGKFLPKSQRELEEEIMQEFLNKVRGK